MSGSDAAAGAAQGAGFSAEQLWNQPRDCQERKQLAEHLGELQPTSCEYAAADEVLVSLKTKTGDIISCTMKTAMLLHLVNLSVTLLNNFSAQVFRDLDVF
jgi:hypothetical protein